MFSYKKESRRRFLLSIEEYIALRKNEDKINEFDTEIRMENLKLCVNYVFEYFNSYLDTTEGEELTALNNERANKYRKQLQDYDNEIQEWLVNIYQEYDKQINRAIGNYLMKDDFFLLYNKDSEFRNLSYECYAHLIKKHPYLKGQTEMLFLFIKEYHRIISEPKEDIKTLNISEGLNLWLVQTWKKHQVNLLKFTFHWVNQFYENEEMWPAKHKKKSQDSWRKYEYDYKQKSNLFNINSLYRRMPKKTFVMGRKQEFEILMMYYWLNDFESDDEGYWEEYINKTTSEI
jgi:hypothetical protein